ncbi:MAG: OmpA family protein [Pseudomonadota bacterium]
MTRTTFSALITCLALGAGPVFAQDLLADDEAYLRLQEQRERTRTMEFVVISNDEAEDGALDEVSVVTFSEDGTEEVVAANDMPPGALRFDPGTELDVPVRFGFDSAVIEDDQQPALQQICRLLTRAINDGFEVFQIVGHTDSSGSDDYNLSLSQLRAEEVGRYLVRDCGIGAQHLRMVGYGEAFPASPEDPAADENRRVEIQALS